MNKVRRVTMVAAAALAMAAVGVATPAVAEPRCRAIRQDPVTIGAGGQDVFTTPALYVEVCVTAEGDPVDPSNLPMLQVDNLVEVNDPPTSATLSPDHFTVWLVNGGVGMTELSVTITYTVGSDTTVTTIPVPLPPPNGVAVCVFYNGPAEENPGGCLAFLNH